ncbi:MAG: hypothetical protein AAB535_00940 [Patescibacteria group bacterium]
MDITYLGHSSFKIKTKTSLVHLNSTKISIESQEGKAKEITGPGEYEISGISVIGINVNKKPVYVLEIEKLRVATLGNMDQKIDSGLVDQLGSIDVLILLPSQASAISEIDPYFAIPAYEDNLESFIKEVGLPNETLAKFSLKKEDILEDQNTKVIVLDKK